MDCRSIKSHFSEHRQGSLPEREREVVVAHLADCRKCALEYKQFETVVGWLGEVERAKAPADIRRRVLSRLHEGTGTEKRQRQVAMTLATVLAARWAVARRRSQLLLAGAGALAISAVAVLLVVTSHRTAPRGPVSPPVEIAMAPPPSTGEAPSAEKGAAGAKEESADLSAVALRESVEAEGLSSTDAASEGDRSLPAPTELAADSAAAEDKHERREPDRPSVPVDSPTQPPVLREGARSRPSTYRSAGEPPALPARPKTSGEAVTGAPAKPAPMAPAPSAGPRATETGASAMFRAASAHAPTPRPAGASAPAPNLPPVRGADGKTGVPGKDGVAGVASTGRDPGTRSGVRARTVATEEPRSVAERAVPAARDGGASPKSNGIAGADGVRGVRGAPGAPGVAEREAEVADAAPGAGARGGAGRAQVGMGEGMGGAGVAPKGNGGAAGGGPGARAARRLKASEFALHVPRQVELGREAKGTVTVRLTQPATEAEVTVALSSGLALKSTGAAGFRQSLGKMSFPAGQTVQVPIRFVATAAGEQSFQVELAAADRSVTGAAHGKLKVIVPAIAGAEGAVETFAYAGADLGRTLQDLAKRWGKRLVLSPQVKGKLTFKARGKTPEAVLREICAAKGLLVGVEGNEVRVAPAPPKPAK